MTNYLSLARVFLSRSKLVTILSLLCIVSVALIPPLAAIYGSNLEMWSSQYFSVTVLAAVGLSLGATLRQVRVWSPAIMVPGLLGRLIVTALFLVFSFWVAYAIVLIASDSLAGYAVHLSLTAGVCSILIGSGAHRKPLAVISVATLSIFFIPELRKILLMALTHPAANIGLLLIIAAASNLLFRSYRQPLTNQESQADLRLSFTDATVSEVKRGKFTAFLSLAPMTKEAAFRAAFGHSKLQAWLNDSFSLLFVIVFALVLLGIAGRAVDEYILVTDCMISLLAVVTPLIHRGSLHTMKDFLWLAGTHENKQLLIFSSFINCLLPALRLLSMGVVMELLLFSYSEDIRLYQFSLAILLLALGFSALVLACGLLLDRYLRNIDNGAIVLFGAVLIIMLGSMCYGAAVLVVLSSLSYLVVSMGIAIVFSAIMLPLAGYVTSKRLSQLKEW